MGKNGKTWEKVKRPPSEHSCGFAGFGKLGKKPEKRPDRGVKQTLYH
jgi:hypothetical protein